MLVMRFFAVPYLHPVICDAPARSIPDTERAAVKGGPAVRDDATVGPRANSLVGRSAVIAGPRRHRQGFG
jgi:hypothetical protein